MLNQGELIREALEATEKGIEQSVLELAGIMNKGRTTIYNMLKQPTWKEKDLVAVERYLNISVPRQAKNEATDTVPLNKYAKVLEELNEVRKEKEHIKIQLDNCLLQLGIKKEGKQPNFF